MNSEAKNLYDTLNEEGTLKQMYGKAMTGAWEKDEKSFTKQYDENEKLFGLDAINLDDDYDDDSFGVDEY